MFPIAQLQMSPSSFSHWYLGFTFFLTLVSCIYHLLQVSLWSCILCNLDSEFIALTNQSYLCILFDKVHLPLSCQAGKIYKNFQTSIPCYISIRSVCLTNSQTYFEDILPFLLSTQFPLFPFYHRVALANLLQQSPYWYSSLLLTQWYSSCYHSRTHILFLGSN